jgi:hypothetical protein
VTVRRRAIWILANVAIPVAFLGLMGWVTWSRRAELEPVFEGPTIDLALIAGLVVIGYFLNATEFVVLYRAQGVPIGLWENWMVFSAGQAGNLLPAQMGTLYKFRYMKAVHGLPYTRNGSNFGANLVISVASSALAGLAGVTISALTGGPSSWVMFGVFAAMAVAGVLAAVIPLPHVHQLRGTPERLWRSFRDGWEDLRSQPVAAIEVLALDVLKLAVTAWRMQLAFSLIGFDQSYWYFLVLAPAAALAGIVAITPAALGFREGFITLAAVAMGSGAAAGLLGATVDRGIMLLAVLTLGVVAYAWTWPRLRASQRPDDENESNSSSATVSAPSP